MCLHQYIMTGMSVVALGLVVAHHVPSLPQGGILRLGVPWFFFASGFWMMKQNLDWRKEVSRRVKNLLLPYYIWNIMWFPILFACNWVGWRYCGANRVVDDSPECIMRCLGLSPWQWPALVPTWFMRALFLVVLIVGGIWQLLSKISSGRCWRISAYLILSLIFAFIYFYRDCWCPQEEWWQGFFCFGISLQGLMCFSFGGFVSYLSEREFSTSIPCNKIVESVFKFVRRQMMPVYLMHVIVIIVCGWVAKAMGCFDCMMTFEGDVIMWFLSILASVAIGEILRRWAPKLSAILFGGR